MTIKIYLMKIEKFIPESASEYVIMFSQLYS